MLYFNTQFDNYEDFRSRFGYKTDEAGNVLYNKSGKPQKMHTIPYLLWKTYVIYLKKYKKRPLSQCIEIAPKFQNNSQVFTYMLNSLPSFTTYTDEDTDSWLVKGYGWKIVGKGEANDLVIVKTPDGKKQQMKLGKYTENVLKLVPCNDLTVCWLTNKTLVTFFVETLVTQYVSLILSYSNLQLVIDKSFDKIYNTEYRPANMTCFNSCMDNDPNYQFYAKRPEIFSAVSLQDNNGLIYARALLVKCFEADNPNCEHTLLERIYFNKQVHANRLFQLAKETNIFDICKRPGASCRDSTDIITREGNKFYPVLAINLNLHYGDILSYQDTFKFYKESNHIAVNSRSYFSYDYDFSTTVVHFQ